MKKIYIPLLMLFAAFSASAQWQYVGTPYISGTSGAQALNLPDMEINSSGEIFVGFETGTSTIKPTYFAKYDGSTWSLLPSPGTFNNVSKIDIEVHGSDYYFSCARVSGSNMYVFVQKYNGSGWSQVGDSLWLGNSGSGGNYDFLLDNNGVPTVLGPILTNGGDKQMMQYSGSAWSSIASIPASAGVVFDENSTIFDSQNKLYCVSQGYVTTPAFEYFTVVSKIDGGVRTTVGDTLYNGLGINTKIKVDANDNPFVCFYAATASKVLAFKLNGGAWSLLGDTAINPGTMYSADITSTGDKLVFYSLGFVPTIGHRIYYYEGSSTYKMDSINATGLVASVGDVIIPSGSSDVYILVEEAINGGLLDLSVMKKAISGSLTGISERELPEVMLNAFPNPSSNGFMLENKSQSGSSVLKIYNVTGQMVYSNIIKPNENIFINSLSTQGMYFVEETSSTGAVKHTTVVIQ